MTDKGLKLIMDFEGLPKNKPLDAYWDSYGKVWTIGYGATHYLDGSPVKKGDKLKSKDEAVELLKMMVKKYEDDMYELVQKPINYYQADALTSFCYNCGVGNFKKSTLLKKVNKNPSDPTIRNEFAKWNKSGGKVLAGLTRRRKAEADLYFTKAEFDAKLEQVVYDKPDEPQVIEQVPTPQPVVEKKSKLSNIFGWLRPKT